MALVFCQLYILPIVWTELCFMCLFVCVVVWYKLISDMLERNLTSYRIVSLVVLSVFKLWNRNNDVLSILVPHQVLSFRGKLLLLLWLIIFIFVSVSLKTPQNELQWSNILLCYQSYRLFVCLAHTKKRPHLLKEINTNGDHLTNKYFPYVLVHRDIHSATVKLKKKCCSSPKLSNSLCGRSLEFGPLVLGYLLGEFW